MICRLPSLQRQDQDPELLIEALLQNSVMKHLAIGIVASRCKACRRSQLELSLLDFCHALAVWRLGRHSAGCKRHHMLARTQSRY